MKFRDRLVGLRKQKGYNQNYIAIYMGVSQVSISNWERGLKEPNFQSLIDLANLFGVSCDFLLGVSDKAETEEKL